MDIEIRSQNVDVSNVLRNYIEHRLGISLRRFKRNVRRVVVRISDLNGPRGGVDKHYRFSAELMPSGGIQLGEMDSDFYAAIDRAAERLGRSVSRTLRRRRESRRGARANKKDGFRSLAYRARA